METPLAIEALFVADNGGCCRNPDLLSPVVTPRDPTTPGIGVSEPGSNATYRRSTRSSMAVHKDIEPADDRSAYSKALEPSQDPGEECAPFYLGKADFLEN